MKSRLATISVLAFLSVGFIHQADAQYFGRNKVQYQDFDFSILHTPHFEIYYYPREKQAADIAAQLAERWYARHSVILKDSLHGTQPMILYASFPAFEETNVIQGIGVGTGGVTEPILRRVVLPFAGPLRETDHVIGHELVHAFQALRMNFFGYAVIEVDYVHPLAAEAPGQPPPNWGWVFNITEGF